MTWIIALAFSAGVLVSLSRALNGRLSLATSPLRASWWNHVVGLGFLVVASALAGQFWPEGVAGTPAWAWAGGTLGVVFVASGSWFVVRIGAALTALMVIAGQMVSGVVLDLAMGRPGGGWTTLGVALILAGMALAQARRR
jgi:transporter family-2 protein